MKLVARKGKDSDWGYVLSTWIRTFPELGDRQVRMNHMRRALGRGMLVVLCSAEDEDTLVGWALSEGNDLLWKYLSKDFRGSKCSQKLLEKLEELSKN